MNCPVCASAMGLKTKEDIFEHMTFEHMDNPTLLIQKSAEYTGASNDANMNSTTAIPAPIGTDAEIKGP